MASDDYCGSYKWDLTENDGLNEFIECEPKQRITAETFNINKLAFTLEAYPNGDCDTNIGSFMLYCTLLSIADNYKEIQLNLRLYCIESNTSFTSIAMFTSQRNSAGWSSDSIKLNELKDNNYKCISIGCDINILQIIDNNNDIIYRYSDKSEIKSLYTFKWNIDSNLMSSFKNCRIGKSFESEIFDKMWCLRCLPNGKRLSDEGNVKLYLLLCSIPTSDHIHIQYTLWCNETNTGYNSKIVLNYEYSTVGWPNKILLTSKMNEFSSLTFNAEIEVIRETKSDDNANNDDDDESTFSSSSSKDYGVKGVISENDPYDDNDNDNDEEKQFEFKNIITTTTPKEEEKTNDSYNDDELRRELSPPQVTPADIIGHQQDIAAFINTQNEDIPPSEPEPEPEPEVEPEIEPTPKSQTPPPPTPDANNNNNICDIGDIGDIVDDEKEKKEEKKKKRIHRKHKNKKKLTVNEFNSVSLEDLIENDVDILDNYDIARKICKFFDSQFDDTDTVCMVAEASKQPSISYWVKGQYVRKQPNICGKHILVYRACKHIEANQPIVSRDEFEDYVKNLSKQYENGSVNIIADKLDNKFGAGCHYARSTTKKPQYDIYCRFSDKYECGFKLKSGLYVIAWRR